jgi:hypothetical protein
MPGRLWAYKRGHQLALALPKLSLAGDQTIAGHEFTDHIVTFQLIVILAVFDVDVPNGIWMHGYHHAAVENVNLEYVAVFLPELADIIQKSRPS